MTATVLAAIPILKPCPFCGHLPDVQFVREGDRLPRRIACMNGACPVIVETTAETIEFAAKSWNTRS